MNLGGAPIDASLSAEGTEELDSHVRLIEPGHGVTDPGHEVAGQSGQLLADLALGDELGVVLGHRYRLLRFLDQGATSKVYLAEDLLTGDEVVAKVLAPEAAASSDLRSRFLAGSRRARSIHHPNVVRIFEVEEPEGAPPYSIMEHLRGEPLGALFRRGELLPPLTAARVCLDIAEGLHAAHLAEVVHRDVKPDNIFLLGKAGAPRGAKILDFGLARCNPEEHEKVVLGTAQYMAPEQVLGDPVDARTDVYSLGVVMFRMFTGHLPFDLELGVDLLRHQLVSPAPPPSWLNEGLDPRLEAIVLRALRKHPELRFPSMRELSQALSEVLESGLCPRSVAPEPQRQELRSDSYTPQSPHARENAALLNITFE